MERLASFVLSVVVSVCANIVSKWLDRKIKGE